MTSQSRCSLDDSFLATGTGWGVREGGRASTNDSTESRPRPLNNRMPPSLLTTSSRLTAPFKGLPGLAEAASSPFFSMPLQFPVPSPSPGGEADDAWGGGEKGGGKGAQLGRAHV